MLRPVPSMEARICVPALAGREVVAARHGDKRPREMA
jgi:hypothetical protein